MPKVRRQKVPAALMEHLKERLNQRTVTFEQLTLLLYWLDTNPEVPHGPWFKRFSGLIVCGEGELVKTFLREGQVPFGEEVN